MLFSSTVFLYAFLPLCLVLYHLAPRGLRNAVLLAFSLLFYAWGEAGYAALMVLSIAGNYVAGKAVARAATPSAKRRALALGVALNLGLLGVFKYAGWLVRELHTLGTLLRLAPPESWADFEVHLPIGISFFTFQAMSYLIDVSRGDAAPQRRAVDFALYIALFPQLVAGPIVRYSDVARQLVRRRHRLGLFASGVQRFVLGLAKKVLIANVVAVPADRIFNTPGDELTVGAAWLGTACYTIQIYFDFSGYSDMAIGLGRMFGFRFRENFLHPYGSASVTDFWRRWHVSLSSWFRDYLYIPLGGSRGGRWHTYRNLWVVFLTCGLWHGASWTFLAWGAYHGALLVGERAFGAWPRRGLLGHVYTLLAVMVGWVLFREATLPEAVAHLATMVGWADPSGPALGAVPLLSPPVVAALLLGALGATRLPLYASVRLGHWMGRRGLGETWRVVGALAVLVLFAAAAAELAGGTYNPFLYFRF
ncbi:MAG: MBOAT family protein [Planctomycetaceae bacterium]|nr:MBOAT family protein [Planctomycetaceae bacterium]